MLALGEPFFADGKHGNPKNMGMFSVHMNGKDALSATTGTCSGFYGFAVDVGRSDSKNDHNEWAIRFGRYKLRKSNELVKTLIFFSNHGTLFLGAEVVVSIF